MKDEKFYEVEEEVSVSLFKAIDIYEELKKRIIRINNKIVLVEDKKILSLYLGIMSTNNDVSKIAKVLGYNYGDGSEFSFIEKMSVDEYFSIYKETFEEIINNFQFDDKINVESLAINLLDNKVVERMNHKLGFSLMPLRTAVEASYYDKKRHKKLTKRLTNQ